MLEVQNLVKHFLLSGNRNVRAVNGVSFNVNANEIMGIAGESGCGKSTLGRLILRLLEPSEGKVFFEGEDLTLLKRAALLKKRRNMQMVFQNPFASFNPKIRVEGALSEVCRYYGMSDDESRKRILKLFNDTNLSPDLLSRWPRELSGGQLQRLAITRALLSDPHLLIADEPLSALDVSIQAQLINLLKSIVNKKTGMVMIFISHDMSVIEYFCDRTAVMYSGRIMELLPASDLPFAKHPYTISLRKSAPQIDAFKNSKNRDDPAFLLKGETPSPLAVYKGCPFSPRCPETVPHCFEELPELKEIKKDHFLRCWKTTSPS